MAVRFYSPKAWRGILVPALGLLLVAYFAHFTVNGNRGLVELARLESEVAEAEARRDALARQRAALEHRVRALHPETIDADLLEERVRAVIHYAHPDDLVVLLDDAETITTAPLAPKPALP